MWSLPRLAVATMVFVTALSAVVWTTASAERAAAVQAFDQDTAAEGMLLAMLARESALRGYGQTRSTDTLAPYDEASIALREATNNVRRFANAAPEQRTSVDRQLAIAERWGESAADAIARIRLDKPVSPESVAARSELMRHFRTENDALRRLVAAQGVAGHSAALRRAIALVLLVSVLFGGAGWAVLRRTRRREDAHRRLVSDYHAGQQEFAETMQITRSESEAHALLKRHLERSLPGSSIVVLNRNNSHNRLEAATELSAGAPIAERLADATPQSCLATRLGRAYEQSPEHEPLLACELCASTGRATCVPSLVGGEVIGSVLVAHEQPLGGRDRSRIDESVAQAAPVLANLRNLAIAEVRAATDGLTGLPNARALRDNLKRMVAQASRSELPLSAVLCDLDHFKRINDVYGHDKGDQALAAVSATLRGGVRASDLAGRYGGEEFLILLPDTPLVGAFVLAEKLRNEVARVEVPGIDRAITASFGVASFPEDAPDAEMLVRIADRALYAAKSRGRNCVVSSADMVAATEPETTSPSS